MLENSTYVQSYNGSGGWYLHDLHNQQTAERGASHTPPRVEQLFVRKACKRKSCNRSPSCAQLMQDNLGGDMSATAAHLLATQTLSCSGFATCQVQCYPRVLRDTTTLPVKWTIPEVHVIASGGGVEQGYWGDRQSTTPHRSLCTCVRWRAHENPNLELDCVYLSNLKN